MEYPFVDKLAVEDSAQPAEIRSLDLTRKEKTITSVFSRRRRGKLGPDNKMHNTNNKCTDDVAVARPVENTKECATSLTVAVNKKGSQVHKSLSTDNRDKPPSCSAIARPQTSGRKKKASKKDKHSTDSAIVPTKGKGDEGSNDGDNLTSSSQVVLYASRVEECAVDTALEETSKGRTKRSLPSKDSEKEALPAKRRRMVKSNNLLPSKDSEAASDKDHLMCQMSIQTIIDDADQLKRIPELIKSVRDAGFGHFIDTKIKGSINRLCVGIAPRISSKEASMVKGLAYDKIRDMDFCQLVVDELQSSAIKWQGHEVLKYKYIEGLAVAPLIMYLDSLIYKDLAHMGKDTPRVLFLDEKNLTAISKADRNISVQKGNEDWVFGKIITWKAKNDRVYKTISEEREEEIMVQKRKSICFAVAGRSFHGENDIPAGTASKHQGTLLIKDSNVVQGDTVNSIKNLMQQVLNLTSNLQTTSQLLNRRIPEDNEDRKIKNLRVQTSSLLSMFELFGEEQKSLLDRYCIDAQSSEMNQVKSIPAANDEHRSCVVKEAHQTVELGVGKATGKQQARIVEEDCKKKSNVMPKKKKKKHKVSNKTDSIGDQQLEEVHPELEHHTGSLPDILNPGNPHIQESNKELAIQMSGKKDAEADKPELGTSAATITGISAHKLAESLNPKDAETSNVIAEADAPDLETSAATISETSADMLAESLDPNDCKTLTGSDDVGCDVSVVATTVGEPSTAEETTQTGPSELMFEESGDAKPKEMLVIMEGPCAISDQNANDALIKDVSDEGTEEENELAPTGDNTADEQEETNVVSCHHDEQKQQINKETSGVQYESKENSNIAIEEDNPDNCSPEFATEPTMTTQDELKYVINNSISEGKRQKNPYPEGPDEVSDDGYNFITDHVHEEICKYSTRSCITGNQDPSSRECMEKFRNQKFIQYGDTEVTLGELADSFEDGAPIKTNIMTIMVDVARSIMTNTKRLIVPFMAVLRCNRIQRNNDGNVNTRKLGNLVKAINPVDDSLLLDRYEIIKNPCFEELDKNDPVGHYFVMSVNLRRKRFELLDSLGGEGAEHHFVNTADVFKEIWKEAYKQSKGKLSPKNLDDFTYEKPKVIPLQGATLNYGVYMIMFLLFWTGKSLFHIRQDDILFIRKRLLYLILMWEKLEVNFGLIETFHKDDFIKINSGEYKIIRKQTTVKPTMTVIVSLPDVNIPKPKEFDDGKENYPKEQEYVLISSQEDYSMECLKGRGRGEYDSKKHLDGNCQPEETTKNGKEDRNQQQQKPVVARNNENSSIEYLRAREAKVDDPSRNSKEKGPPKQKVNLVLFTPPNRKSSPPGYKIEKDMYSSLTGSQSFQTPPKDSKSNSIDVENKDNLNRGKRKLVTPSDVTSIKRPKITARKLCEPVAEYRPKKFKHQVKANKLFNLIGRSNKFDATEVFNAPVMHSVVPDMMVPINGADIKRQFSSGKFLDGGTMDYIIDEMKTTSELYDTGERVLLSQGFIMHVLQVSIWKQSTEQIKEAAQKRGQTFNYTEDFNLEIALDAFHRYVDKGKSLLDAKLTEAMQYSRRSTGSRTQEPAPANLLVYHRRSARERELADERNRAFREEEAVGGLEQLGECLVRTAIMALPSPNAPPHIRRACRPSMPSMAELPRRVDGLHPKEARNQHICAREYPPLEHLERALEGQYLHALIPPETEKEVSASIVLCKVKRAMKRWLIRVRNKLRKQ
ncbi:hypothetical protein ACQ4PT_054735 [Festuca glaucescens]